MRDNPLMAPVLEILRAHPQGVSEYAIICALREQGLYIEEQGDPSMSLYTGHFLVMNALYRLKQTLLVDGLYLTVSPLNSHLRAVAGVGSCRRALLVDPADAALSDYYLDWNNLDTMTREGVEDLLNGFWQRFAADDGASKTAYEVLELEASASWSAIKSAYRRLAAQHHPDKGGNAQAFIDVREAYLRLKGLEGK